MMADVRRAGVLALFFVASASAVAVADAYLRIYAWGYIGVRHSPEEWFRWAIRGYVIILAVAGPLFGFAVWRARPRGLRRSVGRACVAGFAYLIPFSVGMLAPWNYGSPVLPTVVLYGYLVAAAPLLGRWSGAPQAGMTANAELV